MSQYLYVCHFSNGHIKVGRSSAPQSRIAQHESRVSCLGIELVEHFVVECVGNVAQAESALIAFCKGVATKRHVNEWFVGVDYLDACEKAKRSATFARPVPTDVVAATWGEYCQLLADVGITQVEIAQRIGCGQPSISDVYRGRTADPSFRIGFGLLSIGSELGLKPPSFIEPGCLERVIGFDKLEKAA